MCFFVGDEYGVSFDDFRETVEDDSSVEEFFIVFVYAGEKDVFFVFTECFKRTFSDRDDFIANMLECFEDFSFEIFEFFWIKLWWLGDILFTGIVSSKYIEWLCD